MSSVTLVLIHPSYIFSEGLRSLFKDAPIGFAAWAASVDTIPVEALRRENKLVFIVGGWSSTQILEAVESLRDRFSAASTVVLSASSEPGEVLAALKAGANGYLRETMESHALTMAIELVCQDETVLPQEFVKQLSCASAKQEDNMQAPGFGPHRIDHIEWSIPVAHTMEGPHPKVRLSERETVILQELVHGAPNKVIAQKLEITEATVKVHLKAILRKIRVKNRTQAAIWAVKCAESVPSCYSNGGVDGTLVRGFTASSE
jgi:two-component system, NarL family, nitrate/nitrite response regulator NarL